MSTLAGCGTSGLWTIDVDCEDVAENGYEWSITLQHPRLWMQCALSGLTRLEAMLEYLVHGESTSELFQIGTGDGFELLMGISEGRLIFRMGRSGELSETTFPWLLECVLDVEEARSMATALDAALKQAQSSI